VTLTVEGKLDLGKDPVINGKLVGEFDNWWSLEGREVYTFEELCEATHQVIEPGKSYRNFPKVTIKADMTATGGYFKIDTHTALVIDEGVTLTVDCDNFSIMGEFTNNGTIDGRGHIYTDSPIGGKGRIDTGGGLKIGICDADADELGRYLAEDSIYTEVVYINSEYPHFKSIFNMRPDGEKVFTTIKNDLVVPKGKSIWLNINGILKVCEGATLEILGEVKTFNEPVIEGTVIGEITVIDKNKPRDVCTFAELYEAARDRINDVTVKGDIVVPFPKDHLNFETVTIDKGATLTGDKCNFSVSKKLTNNGTIGGNGKIHVRERIDGECGVNTADGLEINISHIAADEIGEYLAEGSIYGAVNFFVREETLVTIEKDLLIPKGKQLWLNVYCTLEVGEGATLVIEGELETYNEPVIKGTVVGEIKVSEKLPFWK